MNLSRYRCPQCHASSFRTEPARWHCEACGQDFPFVDGIPWLLVDRALGARDRKLRTTLYDGFLGRHYQQVMPFLSLPARPARASWVGWLSYFLILAVLLALVFALLTVTFARGGGYSVGLRLAVLLTVVSVGAFFAKHPYLLALLILAVPVKVSLLRRRFVPALSFQDVHAGALEALRDRTETLQVLDLATGTCNSLRRHGWLSLDAEYTGVDLSETMLRQGQRIMAGRQVPIDLVLADAARPPFQSDTFDVVLNYGALNGFTDPRLALEEMARITRKGGLVLFLDEQLYEGATLVERLYFRTVLSSHNTIHRCPVELIPESLGRVQVHQVYAFYYICTCYKT